MRVKSGRDEISGTRRCKRSLSGSNLGSMNDKVDGSYRKRTSSFTEEGSGVHPETGL